MKLLRLTMAAACTLCLATALPSRAQNKPQGATAPVDAATRSAVIEKLTQTLEEKYVDADKGRTVGAHVRQSLAAGTYNDAANAVAFGEAVTRDLQSLGIDRHLRVRFDPQVFALASDTTSGTAGLPPEEIKRLARDNFGFEKVEILMGNVGYLNLRGFMQPDFAGPTAVAAMNFLGNSDALIIDLRQNGGGTPAMIQFITSYLFAGERQHLNDFYTREGEHTTQFWTLPYVPGNRLANVPVYVLTSKRTFSAAEEFTYDLQNLKRATIVGETTGGGAHPGGWFPLTDGFVAFVSTGKAVNPVTKTNWEGIGVKPDIEVPQAEALRVAHAEALKAIAAKETDPEQKTSLAWSAETVESEAHPAVLRSGELRAYAGTYGIRTVTLDGTSLYFQREQQPRLKLIPLGNDFFRAEFMDDFRLHFTRDAKGKVVEITGLAPRGPLFREARTK
jgi:retinol-binding protein 3